MAITSVASLLPLGVSIYRELNRGQSIIWVEPGRNWLHHLRISFSLPWGSLLPILSLQIYEDSHRRRSVGELSEVEGTPVLSPYFYGGRHFCTNAHGIHWMIGAIFVKFSQLIFMKIIKIVATRCQILRLKCTKFNFGWGSTPDLVGDP